MDDGPATVLVFAFPAAGGDDARGVNIWVKDNGCRTISNGFVTFQAPDPLDY